MAASAAIVALASTIGVSGAAHAQGQPKISAPAAIAVEPATGEVVFSRDAARQRPIASATKLMTALVTIENAPLDRVVTTVAYQAAPVESTGGFRGGERVSVRTLLRALLVASANDAAETLAVRVGGTRRRFVAMMNARARQAGLADTRFTNPIGLDAPGNHSSATDLVKMALLLRRSAFVRETADKRAVTITSGGRRRTLPNRNLLVGRVPFVNGLKTGHTRGAGWVLVGSGSRDGVTLVTAVLGASSESARMQDTLALMRYGLGLYRRLTVVRAREPYASVKLEGRDQSEPLVAARSVARTVRKGSGIGLRARVPAELNGPLAAGARAGHLELVYRGRVVETVPLLTTRAIEPAPSLSPSEVAAIVGCAAVALAALCTLGLLIRRRRRGARGSEASTA